ncbi:hypothetical protein [Nocardioides convexus]|uniref:hypothetical protein n=1 Tax=Nocardioides convexus TaxID=2712224 RepID=UPI0024182C48|nr:hypothetical protein [Nocardioides convexus]
MTDPSSLGRTDSWAGVRAVVAGFGASGAAAVDNLLHLGADVHAVAESVSPKILERAESAGGARRADRRPRGRHRTACPPTPTCSSSRRASGRTHRSSWPRASGESRSGARSSWPGGCATPPNRRRGSASPAPTARPPPCRCSTASCAPPGCAASPPGTSACRSPRPSWTPSRTT